MKLDWKKITDKGLGPTNEDHILVGEDYALVLDGATPINRVPIENFASQAAWFVQFFAQTFEGAISEEPSDFSSSALFSEVAKRIIEYCPRSILDLGENKPSLTLALARTTESTLDISVLGDCAIYVYHTTGEVTKYTDERVQKFSQKTIEAQEMERRIGNTGSLVRKQRLENRRYLNKSDGYWVVSIDQSWVDEVKHISIPISDVHSLLICTDGFDRAFTLYRAIPVEQVLNGSVLLSDCLANIREVEKQDEALVKFPRMKSSDDASAVILFQK